MRAFQASEWSKYLGSARPWVSETVGQRDLGSARPWVSETFDQRYLGKLWVSDTLGQARPWVSETLSQRDFRSAVPWETLGQQELGSAVPSVSDTLVDLVDHGEITSLSTTKQRLKIEGQPG